MKNQNEDGTWDLTTELDEASHDQLRALWNVSALRQNALNLGVSQEDSLNAEMWSYGEYKERLSAAQNAEPTDDTPDANPNAGTGSVPIPASIGAQQATGLGQGATDNTEPTPWKEGSRAFADPSLDGKAYDDWTVPQLKAEISKRNELREGSDEYADDEPMSTDGLKDALVSRLAEDDEADAPE